MTVKTIKFKIKARGNIFLFSPGKSPLTLLDNLPDDAIAKLYVTTFLPFPKKMTKL